MSASTSSEIPEDELFLFNNNNSSNNLNNNLEIKLHIGKGVGLLDVGEIKVEFITPETSNGYVLISALSAAIFEVSGEINFSNLALEENHRLIVFRSTASRADVSKFTSRMEKFREAIPSDGSLNKEVFEEFFKLL